MANDKSFKIKNGLLAGRYLQSNGVETAGTEGYSLASASYSGNSLDVSAQDGNNTKGAHIVDSGTKMFTVGSTNDNIYHYNLSTAYDLSTASLVGSFSVASQATFPYSIKLKPDGTKAYVLGISSGAVYQYNLPTAFSLSGASYDNKSVSVTGSGSGIVFKPDGTRMLYIGGGTTVYEYDLSTAWDISTASYTSTSLSISANVSYAGDLDLSEDGTLLFVSDYSGDKVVKYTLSTAYDISTATYDSSYSVTANPANLAQVFNLADSGTKMYISGEDSTIYQYSTVGYTQTLDLSTGNTFSFTPSGATTVSFTNPPASGTAVGFAVEIVGDGSAITWPSSVKWDSGTAPTATASKELYTFITTDGGTTYYGKKAAGDIA